MRHSNLVVTDTSPLIALERLGRLDLLPALFTAYAPPTVITEFGRSLDWLQVRTIRDADRVDQLREIVDRGEAEAIVLALELRGAELLVDETRGRNVAQQLGLKVVGTAGLLLEAKRRGLIESVRPMLEVLIRDHGFRLGSMHFDRVIAAAGED